MQRLEQQRHVVVLGWMVGSFAAGTSSVGVVGSNDFVFWFCASATLFKLLSHVAAHFSSVLL